MNTHESTKELDFQSQNDFENIWTKRVEVEIDQTLIENYLEKIKNYKIADLFKDLKIDEYPFNSIVYFRHLLVNMQNIKIILVPYINKDERKRFLEAHSLMCAEKEYLFLINNEFVSEKIVSFDQAYFKEYAQKNPQGVIKKLKYSDNEPYDYFIARKKS